MRISDWSSDVCSSDLASVAEVRAAGRTLGTFSPDFAAEERDLKRFMYASLYHHSSQVAAADAAKQVVSRLFAAYADDPQRMGEDWAGRLPAGEPATIRHIGDYIAGRSEEHTSELQSLMRISYAVFCLKKKTIQILN